MSIVDLIKSLTVNLSPSWNKRTGTNSTQSKIKATNAMGDVAGRDINKTYVSAPTTKEELPYIYFRGSFGGNGILLRLAACQTFNLSDQFVFLERINILGRTIPFDDSTVIKAGESIQHTGIDDLAYPASDDDRNLEIIFHSKNNKRFVAKQKLKYQPRQDGKFNIIGLSKSVIEPIADEE